MAKILFVCKDMGAANVVIPVAKLALDKNHEVSVITEGLAGAKCREAGLPIIFQGTTNFIEVPFSLDADKIVRSVKPDVVVTGLSEPMHLEGIIGLTANRAGIGLVGIHDFWSCHYRTPARLDACCVLDEFDAIGARERFGESCQIVISGNPGAKTVSVPNNVASNIDEMREAFGKIFVYVGGDPFQTQTELRLLVDCLKKTEFKFHLLPRFHPKYANSPRVSGESETWGEHWHEVLNQADISNGIVSIGNTDQIACCADAVFSGFSTVMTTAVYNKVPSFVLKTKCTIDSMQSVSSLKEIPHGKLGLPTINKPIPIELDMLQPPPSEVWKKFKPYNPIVCLDAALSVPIAL